MDITLEQLRKLGACTSAISWFMDIFGLKTTLEEFLKKVPKAEVTLEIRDWLIWAMGNNAEWIGPIMDNYEIDINAQDSEGRTSLHWAAINNVLDALNSLLEKGADASILNNYNYTALDKALYYSNKEAIRILKNHAKKNSK